MAYYTLDPVTRRPTKHYFSQPGFSLTSNEERQAEINRRNYEAYEQNLKLQEQRNQYDPEEARAAALLHELQNSLNARPKSGFIRLPDGTITSKNTINPEAALAERAAAILEARQNIEENPYWRKLYSDPRTMDKAESIALSLSGSSPLYRRKIQEKQQLADLEDQHSFKRETQQKLLQQELERQRKLETAGPDRVREMFTDLGYRYNPVSKTYTINQRDQDSLGGIGGARDLTPIELNLVKIYGPSVVSSLGLDQTDPRFGFQNLIPEIKQFSSEAENLIQTQMNRLMPEQQKALAQYLTSLESELGRELSPAQKLKAFDNFWKKTALRQPQGYDTKLKALIGEKSADEIDNILDLSMFGAKSKAYPRTIDQTIPASSEPYISEKYFNIH